MCVRGPGFHLLNRSRDTFELSQVWMCGTTESFSSIYRYFLCISKLIFSVYVETVLCVL